MALARKVFARIFVINIRVSSSRRVLNRHPRIMNVGSDVRLTSDQQMNFAVRSAPRDGPISISKSRKPDSAEPTLILAASSVASIVAAAVSLLGDVERLWLTSFGRAESVVVPLPSWPQPFWPQQSAVPPDKSAHVCIWPALTMTPATPGTTVGVRAPVVVPFPS